MKKALILLSLALPFLCLVGCGGSSTPERADLEELKARLTPVQFKVAVQNGTEPAFRNAYWENKEPGIYVDIISGEPLFSSTHKYKSGTGWPSFR